MTQRLLESRGWLISAAASILLLLPFWAYVTDDTYIYMQFARNLADGNGFSFNPGEPTYGFTSPLWVILLAGFNKVGVDLLTVSKLLGQAFTILSIWAMVLLARQVIPGLACRAAAVLVWGVNAWLLRWTLAGLETSMVVFFVLLGLALHLREKREGRPPGYSALAFAVSALLRPECLGLLSLAALDLALFPSAPRLRSLFRLSALSGAVLLPWFAYSLLAFGQIIPDTALAKGGDLALDLRAIARSVLRMGQIAGATVAVEGALLVAALSQLRFCSRDQARSWLGLHALPAAWMVALPALYAVYGVEVVSRYMLPSLAVLILFGYAALDALRGDGQRKEHGPAPVDRRRSIAALLRRRAPWAAALLSVALNLWVLYAIALPSALSFTHGLEDSLVYIGRWLQTETPEDATVGVPDIGALGFFSQRRIIDLSGLVTPEMIGAQKGMNIDQFVESLGFAEVARPDYLIDRYPGPDRFGELGLWPGVTEPLLIRRIGPLGIARPGDYHYTVYRMHWERYEELRKER